MKTLFCLFSLLIAATSFAQSVPAPAEMKRKLVCTNTSFSDLKVIEVYDMGKADSVTVVETEGNGTKTYTDISSKALDAKDIPLSDWYGYDRHVYKDGGDWVLEHRDECSGGYSWPHCTEEN